MSKKKIRCVLDTETAGGLSKPFPYDFSYILYEGAEMREVCRRSFVIKEIFLDATLMDSAYYAKKVPSYWEDIWAGKKQLVSAYFARKTFFDDLAQFNCKECYAYNMAFDRRALNNLMNFSTDGRYKWFWKKGVRLYCIWNMAACAFLAGNDYYKTAIAQGWVSEKGNILTNAECAYRFLTGNFEFVEQHKGIDDSDIEALILKKCLAMHKKLDKTPRGGVWQKAQKINRRNQKKVAAKKIEIQSEIEELEKELKELRKKLAAL